MLFNVSPRTRLKIPSQTEHPTSSLQNAGISLPETPIEDLPIEKFLSVMSINVTASVLCTKYATRLMKSQEPKGGRIINNGR
jgi:NAD(P)-dependent dehydrogenase (short-subunit alcohol dehydrogenase family)